MANVDRCTRLAEAGLCDNVEENAKRIAELPENIKNQIFRGKKAKSIQAMLVRFSETIIEAVEQKYHAKCLGIHPSSNNNKDGADLVCNLSDKDTVTVEVKFGSYTDKAAGMKAAARILGTQIFSDVLSIQQRREARALVAKEYPNLEAHRTRLEGSLNLAIDEFNNSIAEHPLSKKAQTEMENYLLNNSGGYEERPGKYMRFETDKKGQKFVERAPVKKGAGEWQVKKIEPLDFKGGVQRVNVFIYNPSTKVRIKFLLNNKNNYKLKAKELPQGEVTVESKYMLGSPSWNVWVYPPRSPHKAEADQK